jgi:hypothetical protein
MSKVGNFILFLSVEFYKTRILGNFDRDIRSYFN